MIGWTPQITRGVDSGFAKGHIHSKSRTKRRTPSPKRFVLISLGTVLFVTLYVIFVICICEGTEGSRERERLNTQKSPNTTTTTWPIKTKRI